MNDKKIAILLISMVVSLGGIFRAAVLNADSYTSGGGTPTLQQVIDKGSTASGSIVLNANAANDTLSCSHGVGTGNCYEVTAHAGSGAAFVGVRSGTGDVFSGTQSGTGDVIWIQQNGSGDGIQVDNNGAAQGVTIDQSSAGGIGLYVNSNANAVATQINGSAVSEGQLYIGAFKNGWAIDILGNSTYATNWSGPFRAIYGDSAAAEHQIYEMNNVGFMAIGTGSDIDAQDIIFASSTVSKSGMTLRNTNADVNGINLEFDRAPIDGSADNDILQSFVWKGLDSSGTSDIMAKFETTLTDNSTGTEDVDMCMHRMVDGTLTEVACLTSLGWSGPSGIAPSVQVGFESHATNYASVTYIVLPADISTEAIVTAGVYVNIASTGWYQTEIPVEYLVEDSGVWVKLFDLICGVTDSAVTYNSSKALTFTPTAGKSTTFRFSTPVVGGSGTVLTYGDYWLRVESH